MICHPAPDWIQTVVHFRKFMRLIGFKWKIQQHVVSARKPAFIFHKPSAALVSLKCSAPQSTVPWGWAESPCLSQLFVMKAFCQRICQVEMKVYGDDGEEFYLSLALRLLRALCSAGGGTNALWIKCDAGDNRATKHTHTQHMLYMIRNTPNQPFTSHPCTSIISSRIASLLVSLKHPSTSNHATTSL